MHKTLLAVTVMSLTVLSARPATAAGYWTATDVSSARLLAVHNRERARVGVAPLRWDPVLAQAAASYGPALARLGKLRHSPRAARAKQLENLWMGTSGAFSPEQMVGNWIAERAYYRQGTFPDVSRTGRWTDVAHYTQIIWKTTTHVGCAIHRHHAWDYLVCRYSPPGNVEGRRVV